MKKANSLQIDLNKVKCVLENLLPSSIQLYNIIVSMLSGDGVDREVFVNEDLEDKNVAILISNKLESPKIIYSMFCTKNAKKQLELLVKKNVCWTFHDDELKVSKQILFVFSNSKVIMENKVEAEMFPRNGPTSYWYFGECYSAHNP